MTLSESRIEELKKLAAHRAVDWLKSRYNHKEPLTIGAGSGTTVSYAFPRLTEFEDLTAVPTSIQTQDTLTDLGIDTADLCEVGKLTFDIDGADEVDPNLNLTKGGGGCHYREKRVARKSELLAIVADQRKLVNHLGQTFPIPVEIVPKAKEYVVRELRKFGDPKLRREEGDLVLTDNDNLLLDLELNRVYKGNELGNLEVSLNEFDGVVENGLFVSRKADIVFVGTINGVEIIQHGKS